jgi:hypothetical protein
MAGQASPDASTVAGEFLGNRTCEVVVSMATRLVLGPDAVGRMYTSAVLFTYGTYGFRACVKFRVTVGIPSHWLWPF